MTTTSPSTSLPKYLLLSRVSSKEYETRDAPSDSSKTEDEHIHNIIDGVGLQLPFAFSEVIRPSPQQQQPPALFRPLIPEGRERHSLLSHSSSSHPFHHHHHHRRQPNPTFSEAIPIDSPHNHDEDHTNDEDHNHDVDHTNDEDHDDEKKDLIISNKQEMRKCFCHKTRDILIASKCLDRILANGYPSAHVACRGLVSYPYLLRKYLSNRNIRLDDVLSMISYCVELHQPDNDGIGISLEVLFSTLTPLLARGHRFTIKILNGKYIIVDAFYNFCKSKGVFDPYYDQLKGGKSPIQDYDVNFLQSPNSIGNYLDLDDEDGKNYVGFREIYHLLIHTESSLELRRKRLILQEEDVYFKFETQIREACGEYYKFQPEEEILDRVNLNILLLSPHSS